MDRFKFRAWDKDVQQMIDLPSENLYVLWVENPDRLILMQCTGLKDSEGKLIYEGDIVDPLPNGSWTLPNRFVIEYHGMAFQFIGRDRGSIDTITSKTKQVNDLKIIGNIYENPELLKEK